MIFYGEIKNGKLYIFNRENLLEYIATLKGRVQILIDKIRSNRTLDQNRFYWFYLSIIAKETGDNPNDLHEYFKRRLLPPRFVKVLGRTIRLPATTTKLSKSEFAEYLDKICALTNIPIPDTEESRMWLEINS